MFRVYLMYQSNQCKMNTSTNFCNISISKKREWWFRTYKIAFSWRVIVLYPLKCVTSLVSIDIMEQIQVIKLYNRIIKRSQYLLYNVIGWCKLMGQWFLLTPAPCFFSFLLSLISWFTYSSVINSTWMSPWKTV